MEITITCPTCKEKRVKDHRYSWAIRKGIVTEKCFKCSRMKKGESNSKTFIRGHTPWNKGKEVSDKTKKRVSQSRKGKLLLEENHKFKGDRASYVAKHIWMFTNYGKATKCEDCGKTKGMIHWANISDKYKRERSDWKQLCVPCHSKFDRTKKLKNKINNHENCEKSINRRSIRTKSTIRVRG
jgi:hypothetical protein